MVPPEYLEALSRMQDDVAPLSWEAVRGVIEDELGLKPEKVFAGIDEDPLGCASLAQVHRAVLRDGREVALKVQRPGIAEVIREDLALLAGIAERADRMTDLGRRLHFADWVGEFRRTLLAELDYRLEAQNLDRFGTHFAKYPEVFVPKPVWDLTRPRLLTMELVQGTKATDISGLRRTEQDLGGLAAALMRAYLDQVFVHGEIHADPHPGNLLLTDDGRLALFDLGMVAHVPPRQRDRLLKLLFAAVDGRGEEAAAEAIAMGTAGGLRRAALRARGLAAGGPLRGALGRAVDVRGPAGAGPGAPVHRLRPAHPARAQPAGSVLLHLSRWRALDPTWT